MYPYPQGLYGPRPDANMMAAYRQHHQQQQVYQQQQRQGGQWNGAAGMYSGMDHNSNMQGMGYPNCVGQPYPPHMGYAMHQHLQQYGQFIGPMNRQMNDNTNVNNNCSVQPQRPGWAESRPGRTPCKNDWWSHVKDEMQCIDSPKGIDLEKEDEHANVMEELQRTGTTSGVVNDDGDLAAAFDHHHNSGAGGAASGTNGGNLEAPFTSAPPILGVPPGAASGGLDCGYLRQQYQRSSPSAHPWQENREAADRKARHNNKQRRSSKGDENEEGKKKSHKGKSHRHHSLKDGAEGARTSEERRGSVLDDSTALGNSLFQLNNPATPAKDGTRMNNEQQTQQQQRPPRISPPRRPAIDTRTDAAAANKSVNSASMTPAPTLSTAGRPNTNSPGARETPLPNYLPPLHQDDLNKKAKAHEDNAENVLLGDSATWPGQGRPGSVMGENSVSAATRDAHRTDRRDSTTAVDSPSYSMGDNSLNRLSTSESATDNIGPQNSNSKNPAAVSPNNPRKQGQRLYSYFNSRRGTALSGESEERENEEERHSTAAYGSDSEDDDSDGSSSESDEDSDDEEGSEDDDEADYSTMRRTPDHVNNPGRSILEYSAFRDVSVGGGPNAVRGEGDHRRSVGGCYAMGSFSAIGNSDMPSHKGGRPSYPNTSITLPGNSIAMDDRAYMMVDMSLVERNNGNNGLSGIPAAASRNSSAQPYPQGRSYSLSLAHDETFLYTINKPNTPQHQQQQQRGHQIHTLSKEVGEPEGAEIPLERLQRVGAGKRVPPKITTKPTAAAGTGSSNHNEIAAAGTTTLPSVQNHQQQRQQKNSGTDSPSVSSAAATAAAANAKGEKPDTKLTPARTNEKRALPAVMGPNRPSTSTDDRKLRNGSDKESSVSNTIKSLVTSASAAAAKKPQPLQPVMSNTKEVSRGSSGTSAKPSPQASSTNKRAPFFQRVRKGSGVGPLVTEPAGSPATTPAAATSNKASAGEPARGSGAASAGAAAKSPVPPSMGSGKAPLATSHSPQQQQKLPSSSSPDKAALSGGNPALDTTATSSGLGSSKQTSLELATPSSSHAGSTSNTGSTGALTLQSSSPTASRPPCVFPAKVPLTKSAAAVTGSGKSISKKDAEDAQEMLSSGVSHGVNMNGGATSAAPKGLTRCVASSNPPQSNSNPLTLASSTTGLASVALRKEQEAKETTPTATTLKPPASNGIQSVRESLQGSLQQPGSSRTTLSNSPLTAPMGSGKVMLLPGKRSASSNKTTSTSPLAATISRSRESSSNNNSYNTSSMSHRPASSASPEANLGTACTNSSNTSGNSAVQLSSTQRNITSTRVPSGVNVNGSLSTAVAIPPRSTGSPASTFNVPPTTPSAVGDKKAASTPLPNNTTVVNTAHTTVDDDMDSRDAWMADAYDFYAYSRRSRSDDDDGCLPYDKVASTSPPSAGGGGVKCGSSPAVSPTRGGAKRLSTTAGSLADLGYIMF